MNAMNTMLQIADVFVGMCEEMPLKKVSISDIIERTGKNRKTFYYHFENKEYLIIWIFRHDLAEKLKERFPEPILVRENDSSSSISQFPYYITQKSGVRSLDHSEFFRCFADVLESRWKFYRQALAECGSYSLREYLFNLYREAIKDDIYLILSNRYLPTENIEFLADFYTGAFLYYFLGQTNQPTIKNLISKAGPFSNIIHSSLEMEIKEAQLRRRL
jgi:AcrR family transcriptional regulator